jgi:hypothetical protein
MPDKKKGERLILFTDRADADVGPLVAHAQSIGAPELAVPRRIIRIAEVPVLGTGKTVAPLSGRPAPSAGLASGKPGASSRCLRRRAMTFESWCGVTSMPTSRSAVTMWARGLP